jgi:hypothetical protein
MPPVDPCLPQPTQPGDTALARCVAGSPPVIDGDLNDWPNPLFIYDVQHRSAAESNGNWSGNENNNDDTLSASFALRWDLDALYVAVRFRDDSSYVPTYSYWRGDSIEIGLDALRATSSAYAPDGQRLIVAADAKGETYRMSAYATALPMPSGTVVKALTNPNGFTLEAAIPWTVLGTAKAELGKFVGFDISLNDADGGDPTRERSLLWKNAAPGGCLCSNGNACAPYCSTRALYPVMLGGR